MEHTSNENIMEALKLLEEAASQKKDELKNLMSDKYAHLRNLVMEGESDLGQSLACVKERAAKAMAHAKEVGVRKAHEIAHDMDENVHNNPWPYIVGSATTGLLLGYLFARNHK